jgi:hypothetical protein
MMHYNLPYAYNVTQSKDHIQDYIINLIGNYFSYVIEYNKKIIITK